MADAPFFIIKIGGQFVRQAESIMVTRQGRFAQRFDDKEEALRVAKQVLEQLRASAQASTWERKRFKGKAVSVEAWSFTPVSSEVIV